tara:strand:+ start:10792 stop:11001 length:210 start_codon:yes stop_codon:yes gene_type:complete
MANQVSRSYIKQCFKQQRVQLPTETLDMIVNLLKRKVSMMAIRSSECNIKRLTPDLIHLALGKYGDLKK